MGLYNRYILPGMLDFACGLRAIDKQRAKVVPQASGQVLEVGIGTGRNLCHYNKDNVQALYGLDPATDMQPKMRKRMQAAGIKVELVPLSAEKIPRDNASCDTIVLTYTLCSIPDPVAAVKEMLRVLKPGGKLLYCEHGVAPDAGVAKWQKRLTPAWRKISGDCRMDRDIPTLLKAGGFALPDGQQGYIPGPRILSYNYWGVAQAG